MDIYKNIEEYTIWIRNSKYWSYLIWLLICLAIKKFHQIVTELIIRGGKLNISLFFFFFTPTYFTVLKIIRLNFTHHFIMNIPIKQELQQIASDHSLDIHFEDFINLYKKCTAKPYSFLENETTLASDNPLHFIF